MRELDTSTAFRLTATDAGARAGLLTTGHGTIRTPVFMPVGTKATVKSVRVDELEHMRAQIILGNTYHLVLQPGVERLVNAGGLHEFMRWRGPILTDSGGFQVFSLRHTLKLDDEGVTFQSVYNGDTVHFSPESVARAQIGFGSDIAMVLDQCPPGDAARDDVARATSLTSNWARRARAVHLAERRAESWSLTGMPQLQFGIVQGGVHEDLRETSVSELLDIGFDGYAIGGLSVGEDRALTMPSLAAATALLPRDKARYFMGIGDPVGVLDVIARGVDMFDCVLPTRLGRTAAAMVPVSESPNARLNLKNSVHRDADVPILDGCGCATCTGGYTRSYLKHLTGQQEILGLRLLTLHNLHVMVDIVDRARQAITAGRFEAYYAEERARWAPAAYDGK